MGGAIQRGRSAIALLPLSLLGSAAVAQENSAAAEPFAVVRPADYARLEEARDLIDAGTKVRGHSRSGTIDWGTGGFEWLGERTRTGNRLISTARPGSQWQRGYAAHLAIRQNIVPRFALEAGVEVQRTNYGIVRGPLLTNPTNSIAQMAYVGARIGQTSFIRLIGFDHGGWSGNANIELASRIANGEFPARTGTAIEIGRSDFQLGSTLGERRLSLRVERGRTAAASSDASATISWRVHF